MREIKLFLPFYLLIVFILPACGQMTYDEKLDQLYKRTVPLIKTEQLKQILNSEKNLIVLDTRSEEEFSVSHIEKARFIDYDRFKPKDIKDIPKDRKVVVYCSVGYRSERIGEQLQKMGYSDVSNLYGGIFAWKNDGFDVVTDGGQVTDSVHTYNKNWSKWLNQGIKVY